MKRDNWPVGDYGVRPAGKPNRCFYCRQKLGEEHKADCEIRCRTVLVDFTVNLVVDLPEYMDEEAIDFKYNESSWCRSNVIDMLEELVERLKRAAQEDENGSSLCLCPIISGHYVREATEQDEANQGLCVQDLPN